MSLNHKHTVDKLNWLSVAVHGIPIDGGLPVEVSSKDGSRATGIAGDIEWSDVIGYRVVSIDGEIGINAEKETVLGSQVGGDHYKKLGEYQPWVVFHKWMTPEELKGFMKGTVISYLQREADKGQREGIEKAHHTLGLYLELTKNDKS